MRIGIFAAVLFSLSVLLAGGAGQAPQALAQTNEEGSEGPPDGKGSGCDHRKEQTTS